MEEPKQIKFEGTIELADKALREHISKIEVRIDTINERTKNHTRYIKELEKVVKELKNGKQTKAEA